MSSYPSICITILHAYAKIFLDDNVSPHEARLTCENSCSLAERCLLILYTPDLPPTEFLLFRNLQNFFCKGRRSTLQIVYLFFRLFRLCFNETKDLDLFRRGIFALPACWGYTVEDGGDYVKDYFDNL